MSERTVVHMLRHGEVHNPGKVLYGRLPGYNLSVAGEAMAVAAAEWFLGKDVRELVSSPLERAQQTAARQQRQSQRRTRTAWHRAARRVPRGSPPP